MGNKKTGFEKQVDELVSSINKAAQMRGMMPTIEIHNKDGLTFNPIDKPQHYSDKEIEVIDYIRDTLTEDQYEGYCIGNILKYVSRYRLKGGVEDLKKAAYYLEAVIQEVE